MRTLTRAQARMLLDAVAGDRLEALYVLALTTGMRRGELLALKWRQVDLETGTLAVTASLVRTKELGFALSEPKSRQSRRQIVLSKLASEALRRHRSSQAAERLARGADWEDMDLVFPNLVGHPLEPQNLVVRHFRPMLKQLDLPMIRFHDLRHTAASLMLEQVVHAKVVSEMLGHSQIGTTLDLYSHVNPSMQQTAVDAADRALGEIS